MMSSTGFTACMAWSAITAKHLLAPHGPLRVFRDDCTESSCGRLTATTRCIGKADTRIFFATRSTATAISIACGPACRAIRNWSASSRTSARISGGEIFRSSPPGPLRETSGRAAASGSQATSLNRAAAGRAPVTPYGRRRSRASALAGARRAGDGDAGRPQHRGRRSRHLRAAYPSPVKRRSTWRARLVNSGPAGIEGRRSRLLAGRGAGRQSGVGGPAVGGPLLGPLGIALFLGWLGTLGGEARYVVGARGAAARSIRAQISSRAGAAGIGGFSGWGSVVYALSHLAVLLDEPELIARSGSRRRTLRGIDTH